jgi:hypothetical protein
LRSTCDASGATMARREGRVELKPALALMGEETRSDMVERAALKYFRIREPE